MRKRGVSLGATVLVSALIVTLGFALSGLSVSQLNWVARTDCRQQAENLADSVLAQALEKVLADQSFGKTTPGVMLTARLDACPPDAVGLATFDARLAQAQGLRPCVNNLGQVKSAVAADGRTVPAGAVRVVGEGRCRGQVRRVEAILQVPAFPYAIACGGQMEAHGRVLVAGINSTSEVSHILGDPASHPLPADLVANAPGARAIRLEGETTVTGNAQAVGGIDIASPDQVHILGEVRPNAAPVKLPDIPLASFDPAQGTRPFVSLDSDPGRNPTLGGLSRRHGNLTIEGDLNLDSGVLYVDGSLTVTGGIKGKGAVIATGNTTVGRACALDSGNRLALLAGGDISLSGTRGSCLQGIVYANGNFSAEQVTLVGSLIARGQATTMKDCNLLTSPEYRTIPFPVSNTTQTQWQPTPPVVVEQRDPSPPYNGQIHAFYSVTATTDPGPPQTLVVSRYAPDTNTTVTQSFNLTDALACSDAVYQFLCPPGFSSFSTLTEADIRSGYYGAIVLDLQRTDPNYQPPPDTGPGGGNSTVFVLDPSQFLKFIDAARVTLWHDIN